METWLHHKDFIFAVEKKKASLGKDKSLTSPNILRQEENQSRNQLSLEDENIDEVDVQKSKNEDLKGKKDHFVLVVKKGCNYLSQRQNSHFM